MALRLAIVLLLLFISRILIFIFNPGLFAGIGFPHFIFVCFAGLRFDLVTLAITNLLFVILCIIPFRIRYHKTYQWIANFIFFFTNSFALALNFIDVIYFRFTQKRMTFDVFSFVSETGNEIISLIPDFILDFWFIVLTWILFVVVLVWAGKKIIAEKATQRTGLLKAFLFDTIKFIIIFGLVIVAGRGGFQYRPLDIINAGRFTEPKYFALLLNTPFTLIKTKDESSIIPKEYFSDEQKLDAVFSPVNKFDYVAGDFKNYNVVIIILESFTAEHSAYLNPDLENGNYKGYTPFLDSLMNQSLVFRGYANGEKSIDGIPAILSAIPSLMSAPFINSPYASNSFSSIASILKPLGYSTAFYHGGSNGTMGFESYTRIAGFEQYIGRDEYNNENDFDGKWGIFDEEFLQFTSEKLNQMKMPFVASVFTLSSHHPYTIPEKYKDRFPKGKLDIHESIGYADFALQRFFNSVSKMDWFDNTLFVLTADHTYQGFYPFYRTTVGKYSIPIVFYHHGKEWYPLSTETVQQTDILPSILDYLNYNKSFVAFGESVFDTLSPHFAISYLSGVYQLIQNGYVLKFNGEENIAFYQLENDSLLKNNLVSDNDKRMEQMGSLTRAIKQQFDYRMVNNQLFIK